MSHFESTADCVRQCDLLIKQGKLRLAVQLLALLENSDLKRDEVLGVAKICRRAGLFGKGLRILQPLVRNTKPLRIPATPHEVAEYASILSRIGSVREALELLEKIDADVVPEALMYKGFCHILRWEYAQANALFERILRSDRYDHYTRLIARVNLASGLTSEGHVKDAEAMLDETLVLAQKMDARRLLGNLLELRGGARVLRGDYSGATQDLEGALEFFGSAGTYDQLLVRKWLAVIKASREKSIEPLLEFRREAAFHGIWESVREADLLAVRQEFDQKRFDSLLFGSPLPAYRERLLKLLPNQPSEEFIWGDCPEKAFDLRAGKLLPGSGALNAGKKIHHVLVALSRDFYAPRKLGVLFAELYPAENFDVDSSPIRIRQLIKRCRKWIEENRLPISISSSQHGYVMNLGKGFALKLKLDRNLESGADLLWKDLTSAFPNKQSFTISEASEKLRVSTSSVLRMIRPALSEGKLVRQGRGRAVRYKLAG